MVEPMPHKFYDVAVRIVVVGREVLLAEGVPGIGPTIKRMEAAAVESPKLVIPIACSDPFLVLVRAGSLPNV